MAPFQVQGHHPFRKPTNGIGLGHSWVIAATPNAAAAERRSGRCPLTRSPRHQVAVEMSRAFRLSFPAREYVMATGLGVMLLLGVHRYFHQIMATPQLLDDSTRVAHYLHEQGSTVYTYFFGKPYFSIEYGNIRFLASEAQGMDVSNPEPFLQSPVTRRGPVIFLLLGKNREYLPRLRELYPGGREEHHYNRLHQSPFITYEVNL